MIDLLHHKAGKYPLAYALLFLFAAILLISLWCTHLVAADSMLSRGGVTQQATLATPRSFFEDFKARNIGDVITIKVIENLESIKIADVDVSTATDHDALLRFSQDTNTSSTLTPATNDRLNMTNQFAIPVDYGRSRSESISVDNQDVFTALVSALVVEVDPESGNIVVEGSRQVLMEGQTKSLYVRGVANPKDIDANNEMPSYKLANAQLQIIGSGSLTQQKGKGIIQKIFGSIF